MPNDVGQGNRERLSGSKSDFGTLSDNSRSRDGERHQRSKLNTSRRPQPGDNSPDDDGDNCDDSRHNNKH
jgi:hypothetical protein